MKERIQAIIDQQNLTYSKLAEIIGVQRSSISHILTGRNNPSLDLITKILTHFPQIQPNWLLFGTGAMTNSESTETMPKTLFTQPKSNTKSQDNTKTKSSKSKKSQPDIEQNIEKEDKKIEKIIVFYSNKTFDIYTN